MTTFTPLQRTCLCSDVYEHIAVTKTGEEHCECPPGEMPGPGDGCMRINGTVGIHYVFCLFVTLVIIT